MRELHLDSLFPVIGVLALIGCLAGGCAPGSGKSLTGDVDGRRVEWFDVEGTLAAFRWVPNNAQGTPQHVALRELTSGTETEVESGGSYGAVAIEGGVVVYVRKGLGGDPGEIVAYTASSGSTSTVATGRISYVDAAGGRVVWEEQEAGGAVAKLGTSTGSGGAAMDIAEGMTDIMPRIGATHAAWVRQDPNAGEYRLMIYDLGSGSPTATEITSSSRFTVDVSGTNVVYCIFGEPEDAIHVYDIVSRSDRVIATRSRVEDQPRIDGNYIVWTEHIPKEDFGGVPGQPLFDERDFRNLMCHDLASGSTRELAHNVYGLRDPLPVADGTVYARVPRAITPPGQSNTVDEIDIRRF